MKKLTLVWVLLLATTFSYSQCSKYREYVPLQITVNYGSEITLGGELLYQFQKNIVGFGYAGYVGSNSAHWSLDNDNYHVKNEALYLTYQRQMDKIVVGVKFGKQNMADWNKVITAYNSAGNPNGYTFEKDANDYTPMVGASVGYCLSETFRISLGIDTFSKVTLGFTAGF
jgi:hypothetical protein